MTQLSGTELRRLVAKELYPSLEEVPAPIDEFILSADYLGLKGQVWPGVMEDLCELFRPEGEGFKYSEGVFLEAIGGGKSFKVSIATAYLSYWLLCIKEPASKFGLAAGTKIALMNLAPSAKKAKDVVFSEINERLKRSPWFKAYGTPDDRISSELRLPKGIVIVPGNSSKRFPLGYNIYGGTLDEASYWETMENVGKSSVETTDEVYTGLKRRVRSRFGSKGGMILIISSPQYVDDFAERKLLECRTNPRILGRRRSLWEAKPKGTYSEKTFEDRIKLGTRETVLEVPEDFLEDWQQNPHKARRDIAAMPSLAVNPFLDAEAVDSIAESSQLVSPIAAEDEHGYILELHPNFKPALAPYAMHVDLAVSRDACGMALGHWDRERQKKIIDIAQEIRTRKKRMDFEWVRQFIRKLKLMGFNIARISFDGFQSVDMMQQLEKAGFHVELLSVDRDTAAYDTLLDDINRKAVDYHPNEVFQREAKRLELVAGKKVDHPPKGSKNVADAVAGVCYHLAELRTEAQIPRQRVIINPRGKKNWR